jgi:nitrite reductase/ring-hydroxylating ferredoxin subunit
VTAHRVAAVADVPSDRPLIVTVGSLELGIYRIGDDIVAWRNHCPHMAAPVCRGQVTGTRLPSARYAYELGLDGRVQQCPWHGWEFDLRTGEHLAAGSTARLRGYPVEVRDGEVFVHTRV